jgi:hypothetical protein
MLEQIEEIILDMKSAQQRMHALAEKVPDEKWAIRAVPDRWSIVENVEHLNLFSERFVPLVSNGLTEARKLGGMGESGRYRRGFIGGMLYRYMAPPVRFGRAKSKDSFVPHVPLGGRNAAEIRQRFDAYQEQLIALTAACDRLPIDKVPITSPVDDRLHYNLFAALGIIARHQHRHLWQAEQSIPG